MSMQRNTRSSGTVRMHATVLLALPLLWAGASWSAAPARPDFTGEIRKQEAIYHGRGEQLRDGYTIDRSLADYADALSSGFDRELAKLGRGDKWLDIGAGRGKAVLDYSSTNYDLKQAEYREPGRKARAVAMSIEDRRTPQWMQQAEALGPERIQYLHGKRLREYSAQELGKFQLITDVIGGFSYTDNISGFVERVLGLLELNGHFYTVLQDVHSEKGSNKPFYDKAPYLTEMEKADGSKVKTCEWLKSITCVVVTCEFKTDWKPPIESYHVQKVCEDVRVPALTPVHYEAGTPPERRFRLRN